MQRHRVALMVAAKEGPSALSHVISSIRAEVPAQFHTRETLAKRVFYHKPLSDLHYAGHIKCNVTPVPLVHEGDLQ